MAEERCLDMLSQPAQSRREVCCLVMPIPALELNGKDLWSSPRGAYSPPGKSILEVYLFASPDLLKKQGTAIIGLMDWYPSPHSCGSTNWWPFLIWFQSFQINWNVTVTSYTFRKNSWPVEKREMLMVPWGDGHVKYNDVETIWVWGCQAETLNEKGPSP